MSTIVICVLASKIGMKKGSFRRNQCNLAYMGEVED